MFKADAEMTSRNIIYNKFKKCNKSQFTSLWIQKFVSLQ